MGYKDDLIRERDITASNYRQGKMSPYDDPFNDTYYDLKICVDKKTRKQNKDYVINEIITKLEELLYEED